MELPVVMRIPLVLLLIVVPLTGGCFEQSIVHVDRTEGPVVQPDASDDSGIDPQAGCLACLMAPEEPGPGCQTVFNTCQQNEKCKIFIDCGYELQCFKGSKRAVFGCGQPCLARVGALTPEDPALLLASNFFQCATNGPCGDICFQTE
jgi:hypothetical protein